MHQPVNVVVHIIKKFLFGLDINCNSNQHLFRGVWFYTSTQKLWCCLLDQCWRNGVAFPQMPKKVIPDASILSMKKVGVLILLHSLLSASIGSMFDAIHAG